jgi:hypothetical protein
VGPARGVPEIRQPRELRRDPPRETWGTRAPIFVFAGIAGQHYQSDPRYEPGIIGDIGREAPGEVRLVELHGYQKVRLEVPDVGTRVPPDDHPLVEAEDVSGPVELYGGQSESRSIHPTPDPLRLQRELDVR